MPHQTFPSSLLPYYPISPITDDNATNLNMATEKALKKILLEQTILDEFAERIEVSEAKQILTYWFRCAVSTDGGAHENEIELFLALSKVIDHLVDDD